MTNKKEWVDFLEGGYIHHTRVNEFTVVTRPATEGEIAAHEARKEAEAENAGLEQAASKLESIISEQGEKIAELEQENANLKRLNEVLTAQLQPAAPDSGGGKTEGE